AEAEHLDPSLRSFPSIAEMASALEIDFVDVCTPPAAHSAAILAAIDRGWNVLCEKPLVLDPQHLAEIRKRATQRNVAVVPAHNWNYAPSIRRATELLRDGAIGTLRGVELITLRRGSAATAIGTEDNWRRDPALAGGGILMDHGWHSIYLALNWFREQPVDVSSKLRRGSRGSVENEGVVVLTFPSGQARIELTWNANVRANRIRLSGEGGEIRIDDGALVAPDEKSQFEPLSAGSHHADWFAAMLPDVIAAFHDPTLASAAFEEAATCLDVIRRAYDFAAWD